MRQPSRELQKSHCLSDGIFVYGYVDIKIWFPPFLKEPYFCSMKFIIFKAAFHFNGHMLFQILKSGLFVPLALFIFISVFHIKTSIFSKNYMNQLSTDYLL